MELTLWTDQREWDESLERIGPVRTFTPDSVPWEELNRADLNVYNLGSNPAFHSAIWRVSQKHPGLVILHEPVMVEFFAHLYGEQLEYPQGFYDLVERYHGWSARIEAEALLGQAVSVPHMAERFPCTEPAIENALAVVVHARDALRAIPSRGDVPIMYVPMPYEPSVLAESSAPGSPGRGDDSSPYRLIVFGHLGPDRRLDKIVEALATLPRRSEFRLDIYGDLPSSEEVLAKVKALDAERLVQLHGYVSGAELDRALHEADLAINLRYPTRSEASLSQLRIWDHALPSLVTKADWYESLPPDTVAFVRPEAEIADLQTHLTAFLAEPDRFRQMGRNGRRWLEQVHDPAICVNAIVQAAAYAQPLRSRATALSLAERVASELSGWAGQDTLRQAVERTVVEIRAVMVGTGDRPSALSAESRETNPQQPPVPRAVASRGQELHELADTAGGLRAWTAELRSRVGDRARHGGLSEVMQSRLAQLREALRERDRALAQQRQDVLRLHGEVAQRDETITRLHGEVVKGHETIAWLHREVAERDETIAWLHQEVAKRDATVDALRTRLARASGQVADPEPSPDVSAELPRTDASI